MITHRSPISGIAAYDNTYVATAGYDNIIILWDGKTNRSIARGCHDHLVNQCSFSPDGKYLASTSSDYTTRIWEIPSMKLKAVLIGHSDDTEGVSFHPSKDLIATSSRDADIRVFDLDGKLLKVLKGHKDDVISVEWMKNDDVLISSSDDGTVKFWDYNSGEIVKDLSFDDVETDTIAVTADGTIFAGNDEGEIVIISQDKDPVNIPAHEAGIKRLVYSDAVKKLISLSYDRSFKVWNYENDGISMGAAHQFNNMVWPRSCAFLNNEEIVFGTFGNKYAQFNLKTQQWLNNDIEPTYGINAICEINSDTYAIGDSGYVYKNGKKINEVGSLCNFIIEFEGIILAGGQTGEIFNAVTAEVFYQHNSPLNCAAKFKHNGKPALIIGTYTGEGVVLTLSDNGTIEFLKTVKLHDNAIKGISASRESIFSVCATAAAAYHDVNTFECTLYIGDAHFKIANGCVTCGEEGFASISRDLKLRFWEEGKARVIDTAHKNSIKSVMSDETGRYVILGDYVGFVSVFDKELDKFVKHIRLSDFGISSICYSETDKKFIASCYDGKPYDVLIEN